MPKKRAVASRKAFAYKLPELGAGPDVPLTTEEKPKPLAPGAQSVGLGFELGALAVPTNGVNGFSPNFAPGGRAYLRVPLWDRTYLKASLGYFYQSNGNLAIPVTRHVFEIGGTLQYSLVHAGSFRLLGGLAARVDLALVQENNAFGQPISSLQTALRGGPALGALFGIAPSTSLSLDLDGTYSTNGQFAFGGAAGVVFYWQ